MSKWARTLVWAACGAAATARADKEFTYRFVPGNELRAVAKFERTTRRTVKEKRVPSTQIGTVSTVTEVKSVDAQGVATVELRVLKVEFTDNFPQRKFISDDSRRQDKADGWELYKDAKLTARVDAKGKISDVKPDADTAAYWASQPREFRDLVEGDGLVRLLPFALPLPAKAVTTNVGWRQPQAAVEGRPFGKREIALLYSYAGNRKDAGHAFDEISVRGEVKPPEATAKYDLLLSSVDGRADFETAKGELWSYRVVEDYLYNPKGAKPPKHVVLIGGNEKGGGSGDDGDGMAGKEPPKKETKKKKDGKSGKGMGMGMPGKGMKGKDASEREKEKQKEKEKEEEERDKSVELQLVRTFTLSYHGKPLKDSE